MKSGRFEILLDYAQKTDSQIILPRLVLEELAANYERELRARVGKLVRAKEQIQGVTVGLTLPAIEVDIPALVGTYVEYVRQRLHLDESTTPDHKEEHLRDAISRGIRRRRPCTDSGEEIRDAVLWNTLLDLASTTGAPTAFVSKNTKQFTEDKVALHPELMAEAAGLNIRVDYYPSLEDFGRAHATRIAFVTKSWIQKQVSSDRLVDRASALLEEHATRRIERQSSSHEDLTGYPRIIGENLEVDEFFVYEMEDGSFRIQATWIGWIEFEYEAEVTEESDVWEYDYDDDSYGEYAHRQRMRPRRRLIIRTVEADASIVVEGRASKEQFEEWSIVDAWLD